MKIFRACLLSKRSSIWEMGLSNFLVFFLTLIVLVDMTQLVASKGIISRKKAKLPICSKVGSIRSHSTVWWKKITLIVELNRRLKVLSTLDEYNYRAVSHEENEKKTLKLMDEVINLLFCFKRKVFWRRRDSMKKLNEKPSPSKQSYLTMAKSSVAWSIHVLEDSSSRKFSAHQRDSESRFGCPCEDDTWENVCWGICGDAKIVLITQSVSAKISAVE